jgi:hypothetical protein
MKPYEKAYDDRESREKAMEILKEYQPVLNSRYDVTDITCDGFYVDVKNHDRKINDYEYAGINDYTYNKYIKLDKPVYVLFLFTDKFYALIDINKEYREWKGTANDRAKGRIQKTFYNYQIKDAIKLEYYG